MNHHTLSPHFHQHPYYSPQYCHDPAWAAFGYPRSLHPAWQQQQQHLQHQHRVERQHHASLVAAEFHPPAFSSRHPIQLPLRERQHTHPAHLQQPMAASHSQQTAEEELAELQKLSNEYEPETLGPLVGPRQPSTAITSEYASADPVFQAKTAALPQKYSHYRSIKGDGKCGWRAAAFGYFETLIHLGDGNKFLEEETRLRSLSNVANAAGFDPITYEDFASETFDFLRRLANCLASGDAEDVLLAAFNDENLQNYFITHLKVLTAAWMKTRAPEYAPWLITQTVDEYCNANVMPLCSEIDNVGLSALKDVFLSPAGITLEVLYLDRSEGSEVNMHRFSPVNHGGFDIGTVRLLYRPGHYDLLYMAQDIPHLAMSASIPTFLQYSTQQVHEPYEIGVPEALMDIPGISLANVSHGWMSGSTYGSDFFSTPPPTQQCVQAMPTPVAPPAQPMQLQSQPVYIPPATPTHLVAPPSHIPQDLAIRNVPHGPMASQLGFQHQLEGPFRASAWTLRRDLSSATSHIPLQTPIFRNSHFNTAHFLNAEFQPEQWHPDEDCVTPNNKTSRQKING